VTASVPTPVAGDAAAGGALTAAELAALVGGELVGDGTVRLAGVAALDRADASHLSVLASARYAGWFATTRAGAVLVAESLREAPGSPAARVVVADPMRALLDVLPRYHRRPAVARGVHPTAVVSATARLGADVSVGPFAVIGEDVVLGDRVVVGAHATIGDGTTVGADSVLHPHATCYPFTELGRRVTLHAGARVGREGFGWVPVDGAARRLPHVGRCVLEDDVEVGANSCVDRGSIDDTVIGAGSKLDNHVHVAHNVRLGRGCFLAAQVGIAGSTRLEDGVQLGGQVGLAGHLTVGRGATLAAQAGVFGDVPAGETWSGHPARPHREQLRAYAALHRLAGIIRPLERLLRGRGTDAAGAMPPRPAAGGGSADAAAASDAEPGR
jgi:UDP-3-O-[3-hydroxymyristoyl] glucosamine N-acyltransferase